MIHVILHPTGRGVVGLPGRSVPLEADTLAAAREQALAVLTSHAAVQALPLDVTADDDGTTVRFAVHPDGRVIVHREGARRRASEPVGPSQVPAPMAPPEAYMPAAGSAALAAPIDVDPTPPPLPVMPSPDEQVAIVTAATDPEAADWTPNPELPDEVEATIVRNAGDRREAQLVFTTGESVSIAGTALIGRRPAADEGEAVDQLVTIDDPERSVSKSHLMAGWNDAGFWITDRDSGNGTVVFPVDGGPAAQLHAGDPHTLADGDRVAIGDQTFTVHLAKLTKE
jgi:pSer/pThr/pTyr-binding forkhead associated (FHA) protein